MDFFNEPKTPCFPAQYDDEGYGTHVRCLGCGVRARYVKNMYFPHTKDCMFNGLHQPCNPPNNNRRKYRKNRKSRNNRKSRKNRSTRKR